MTGSYNPPSYVSRALTVAETRTNTSTLTDTALTVSVGAGTWRVDVLMVGRVTIDTDIKYALVGSGGVSKIMAGLRALANNAPNSYAIDSLQTGGTTLGPFVLTSNGDSSFYTMEAVYTVASSSSFTVQLAQATASAGVVNINPGSFIRAEKLA